MNRNNMKNDKLISFLYNVIIKFLFINSPKHSLHSDFEIGSIYKINMFANYTKIIKNDLTELESKPQIRQKREKRKDKSFAY